MKRRAPALYPDAVTLRHSVQPRTILSRVDATPGCHVKDSFSSLELAPHGFQVLFEATWIMRSGRVARPRDAIGDWELVGDNAGFAAWELAWRGGEGVRDVLLRDLVADLAVSVIAARSGADVVAGGVLAASHGVVGITNLFDRTASTTTGWSVCETAAQVLFPDSPLVGYENGESLEAARARGFTTCGALRVWELD